ncbi:MAG: hypothetical protein GEV04_07695 [Actinophytocola sp.]|nr:hypothetical protein [Actinophytocola sp.]
MNQQDDTDFTDGLRASLSDDRFALTPTASARETIVAAARTRRRRREAAYVTGGSLAVAGVLLGGFLLVSPQHPEGGTTLAEDTPSMPRTAEAGAEARMESAPEPRAVPDKATAQREMLDARDEATVRLQVGPDGYRALRLGMSYDEIRATGMLADQDGPPPNNCARYRLSGADVAVRHILVSENVGLAAVVANKARTPEGVTIGSTRAELERTYDAAEADDPGKYLIPTGKGGYYLFRVDGERVSELALVANKHDCGLP